MKNKFWINAARVLLGLLAVLGIGAFLGLRTITLVNPWIVCAICLAIAIVLSILLANKDMTVIPFKNYPLRLVSWILLLFSIFTGAFYVVNYIGADDNNSTPTTATVERRYYKTRHRTKRIRRGRYAPTGETYKDHYADLRLEDGHLVTIYLSATQARRLKKGQRLEAHVSPGAFGIPVVLRQTIRQ